MVTKETRCCIDCGKPSSPMVASWFHQPPESYRCIKCAKKHNYLANPKIKEKIKESINKLYGTECYREKQKNAILSCVKTTEWKEKQKNGSQIRSKNPQWQESFKQMIRERSQNTRWREKNSGKNCYLWCGGSSFTPYCFKFNNNRKKSVREFFGNMCICCGKSVTENVVKHFGQVELSVHHIEHDKEEGCNGKPFNLVPLCNTCHSKELKNKNSYKKYINKILNDGFEWGIWSREQYEQGVMNG